MYPPPAAGPGTQSPPPPGGGTGCGDWRLAAGGSSRRLAFLKDSFTNPSCYAHRTTGGAPAAGRATVPPPGGGDCKGWRLAAGTYIYIYIYIYCY